MRISPRFAAFALTCLWLAACSSREGLNFDCAWVADPPFTADVRNNTDVAHLLDDIRVAQELAIRHGDHIAGWRLVDTFGIVSRHGGIRNRDAGRLAREQCAATLVATIRSVHGVDQSDIDAILPRLEDRGMDLPITIPIVVVFALALHRFLRWLRHRFDSGEWAGRAVATLLGSIGITAAILAIGAGWAVVVEVVRVGNEHLGSRARTAGLRDNFLVMFVLGVAASWIASAIAAVRARRDYET